MTVKELKEELDKVENENIEVIMYDEMFGGSEIDYVVHQPEEPRLNFKERVELLIGCEIDANRRQK